MRRDEARREAIVATKAEKLKRKRAQRRKTPAAEAKAAAQASTRRVVVESRLVAAPGWVDPGQPWYVLKLQTRRESTAEKELRALSFEAWLPRIGMTTMVRGKESESEIALFPGYLMLCIQDCDLAEVFACIGEVENMLHLGLGFVGVADGSGKVVRPLRLPVRFLERLVGRLASGEAPVAAAPRRGGMAIGETVRIRSGPLSSFAGVVERIMPELGKLVIAADIFGRSTPVELELDQIERV